MTKQRLLIGMICLLALSMVGCGAPPPVLGIPTHYITYINEGLFSISYPPDWEPATSVMGGQSEEVAETLKRADPELSLRRAGLLLLVGLPTEEGWAPNVNIIVEPLPRGELTHNDMVKAQMANVEITLQDYHEIYLIKTIVDGKEATILEYEATYPGIGRLHQLVMLILVGNNSWMVTCTPQLGEFNKWSDDFNAVVRSLRILQ